MCDGRRMALRAGKFSEDDFPPQAVASVSHSRTKSEVCPVFTAKRKFHYKISLLLVS